MNLNLFKLLDYGFAIFVGALLLLLTIWLIRNLITQLKQQLNALNIIITNHLPHFKEEIGKIEDKVNVLPSLQIVCVEGFQKVSTALDKGLDRQTALFEKVLLAHGPILLEVKPTPDHPLPVQIELKTIPPDKATLSL
jgi:hypothetical protein